jgi:hypothetical protein
MGLVFQASKIHKKNETWAETAQNFATAISYNKLGEFLERNGAKNSTTTLSQSSPYKL